MFSFISRYFWVIALAVSAINYLRSSDDVRFADDPIRAQESRTLKGYFAVFSAAPWLIVAVGALSGSTPTVWYYFRPQDGNSFVIAFVVAIFLLSLAQAYWIIFADGARKAADYGLIRWQSFAGSKPASPLFIKIIAAIGPFFILIWVCLLTQMDVTIPKLLPTDN